MKDKFERDFRQRWKPYSIRNSRKDDIYYYGIRLCAVALVFAPIILIMLKAEIATAIAAIGAIATFIYLLLSVRQSDLTMRMDLYFKFNSRYDDDNDTLRETNDIDVMLDYINLCAEEYYYYTQLIIDNIMWQTWYDGMVEKFSCNDQLYSLLQKEIEKNQFYYGAKKMFDNLVNDINKVKKQDKS